MRTTFTLAAALMLAAAPAPGQSRAANLTTLASFNRTDGERPSGALTLDADGNLLGTTELGGNANGSGGGTVFEVIKGAASYASAPTTLYVFCAQTNCADGAFPYAGLIADANGNLFGTT